MSAAPPDLARAALLRYRLPGDPCLSFVRHGENTTYSVKTADGARYALRLHRPGYQTTEAIRSELAWMESLCESGVRTPAAVPGVDGDRLQSVASPEGESRAVTLLRWVAGVPLSAIDDVQPWRRLGALMARIHEHARGWHRPDWFTRPAWDADALVGERPRWGAPDPDGLLPGEERRLLEQCSAEVAARLASVGRQPDRFGLIHGDLGFENVLVAEGGEVAVIDFDDGGDGWFVHELAVALYPHEGAEGFQERCAELVAGYREVSPLPEDLLCELPTFLMARRLASLGWVFSRAETEHARAQRARRLAGTPIAMRRFLEWARERPIAGALR